MKKEPKCSACDDTGWKPAIGPCADGSYISSRPCECEAYWDWVDRDRQRAQMHLSEQAGELKYE